MTKQPESKKDASRKKLIREERRKYVQGRGKSFTCEEVKQMAHNKGQTKIKALDQEFAFYLPLLNVRQKRVVLASVKAFVRS
jgi:hypothetical protein